MHFTHQERLAYVRERYAQQQGYSLADMERPIRHAAILYHRRRVPTLDEALVAAAIVCDKDIDHALTERAFTIRQARR